MLSKLRNIHQGVSPAGLTAATNILAFFSWSGMLFRTSFSLEKGEISEGQTKRTFFQGRIAKRFRNWLPVLAARAVLPVWPFKAFLFQVWLTTFSSRQMGLICSEIQSDNKCLLVLGTSRNHELPGPCFLCGCDPIHGKNQSVYWFWTKTEA